MAKRRRSRRAVDGQPPERRRVPVATPDAEHVVFSFEHLDLSDETFGLAGCDDRYLTKLLERLRDICQLSGREFRTSRSPTLRTHAIDFADTIRPSGFRIADESMGLPYQFALTRNEHGRVHGHLIGNIFFVVWLDPHHRLYP